MVRVYDTLAREKVAVVPREPGKMSIYVCGPTVYEVPHVGHGRAAVVFDVIRRYLEWRGVRVTFVSNVTDVEDKIITRAAQEGSTESEVAQRYEAAYWQAMDHLGVRRPDQVPRATGYIEPMIDLIGDLVREGRAYVVEGHGVYFDAFAYEGYGELAGRTHDDLSKSAGARIEIDERKRSPVDFALWKAAKPGEPSWPSPWGPGRPGWHIECSAMSLRLLGDGFDLHGGGDDLVFPHHENERAQAEASGHRFARYWIHNGMVMVGNEKMAKSKRNFTTLADALGTHGPRAIRMAVLQTHYRKPMELGDREMRTAGEAVARLDALVRRSRSAGVTEREPFAGAADAFRGAMDDDFATPAAVAVIFEAVAEANRAIDADDLRRAGSFVATVRTLAGALGLELDDGSGVAADAEIASRVRERDEARARRDFATADGIRAELAARGITLEDTPTGTIWRR